MRHPLHPALVHFPVACWSMAVIADFASLFLGPMAWQWANGLLLVGCGMGLLAMLAGLMELERVPEGEATRDVYLHIGAMSAALVLFIVRLLLDSEVFQPDAPGPLALALDAAGLVALFIGGWLGGRLVYGHGIGRN